MNRFKIMPMRYAAEGQYEIREYLHQDHYHIRANYLTIQDARTLIARLEA